MVLNFWHERNRRLAKERAEGREVAHAAWTAWNSRRIEAEKRGERFDELPPSINGR